MKRIGIDVGGTNTDAVLVDGGRVVRAVKSPTTDDVTDGFVRSIRGLGLGRDLAEVGAIMVGTTHFVNAVAQRRNLSKVAAIRIGSPAGRDLPPFCDWPADLTAEVRGPVFAIEGGHDYDGRRFMPLDRAALREAARQIRASDIRSIVVTAMFSPIESSDETAAEEILRDVVPDIRITKSHTLGRIGLLERENAALMNAALVDLAEVTMRSFRSAVEQLGCRAQLFVTQNDGTIVDADRASALPIYSFASGPTNSMRGAAYLSGLSDAIVADVGGTTTDVGQIENGFPREANAVMHVGGVRTLFRMPDVLSIAIGGGSIVDLDRVTVGPRSVGYRLTQEAMVFGGETLTLTDCAVAAGLLDLGDRKRVSHLGKAVLDPIFSACRTRIEETIDRMKIRAGDAPLLAVGGGATLIPGELDGVAEVVRVEHGDCANAVGAAIAQVSGEVDQIFQGVPRSEAISTARRLADSQALDAGAVPGSLSVVEIEDIPVAYLPGNAMRVRVKVVGDIAIT